MMDRIERACGRLGLPPWIGFLLASALLFLVGSASFAWSGASSTAQMGVLGAIVAVAAIAAFARR